MHWCHNVINDVKTIHTDWHWLYNNEISNKQMTLCKLNALLWCKPTLIEADLDIQCRDYVLSYATIPWLYGCFKAG